MTNYHRKKMKDMDGMSVYEKACHIGFLLSMKKLKSVTLCTHLCLFCDNQSQKSMGLEKLCQTVVARNGQANLQITLNKGEGGPTLTIFVNDCFQNLKILKRVL